MKEEIEALKKKLNDLNTQLEMAYAENESIKKAKDLYKKKYNDKEAEYNVLLKNNQEFQVTVPENVKEMHQMFERLAASQKAVPLGCHFSAIETLRTTDNTKKYHIGHDIWISENEYNGMLSASKSPSQLAGNITTLFFTMDEILTSTKTGFKSRRGGTAREKCGKLDSVKLAACEAFYKYWLENIYTPVTKEDAKNLNLDMVRYNYYACKKIADLKKPPAQKRAPKRKTKGTLTKSQNKNKEGNESKNGDEEEDFENNIENEGSEKDRQSDGDNDDDIANTREDDVESLVDQEVEHNEDGDEEDEEIEEKIENDASVSRTDPLFIDPDELDNINSFHYSPTLSPSTSVENIPELNQ